MAENIDDYLEDQQQRKKQENQQKKFSDFLITFKCKKCGTPYYDMYILAYKNAIACKCGEWYTPKCLECGNKLSFDFDKEAFACRKCNAIFKLPIITGHYTFVRECAHRDCIPS
jgi:DNA-directed RNA polymerase subunit RPC12/RpoP